MVLTLSQVELAFVSWFALCLLLMPWPVPRGLAGPGIVLVAVQTMAVRAMHGDGEVIVGPRRTPEVDTLAEAVGVFVVPACTAVLILVVLWHLARANAQVRRRAALTGGRPARAGGAQAMGRDMPTGSGAAAGDGSCMTGSSIGDSATKPRAA